MGQEVSCVGKRTSERAFPSHRPRVPLSLCSVTGDNLFTNLSTWNPEPVQPTRNCLQPTSPPLTLQHQTPTAHLCHCLLIVCSPACLPQVCLVFAQQFHISSGCAKPANSSLSRGQAIPSPMRSEPLASLSFLG